MEKYILTSTIYYGAKEYIFYGIAYAKESNSQLEILNEQPSLSNDINKINDMINILNKYKLDPSYLHKMAEVILNMTD